MTIVQTPKPPYYAVIFTSLRTAVEKDYDKTANLMVELAEQQPGFIGIESVRETLGITVSYWKDLKSIQLWKAQMDHQVAQKRGRGEWYASYKTRIAKVERDYGFETKPE